MSIVILGIATVMILLAVLMFAFKLMVAFDHCSGGAPLLDGVIFPPLFLGIGSSLISKSYGMNISGFVVGIISIVVMATAYFLAWKLGASRKQSELRKPRLTDNEK